MHTIGTRVIGRGATLAIWKRPGGYYWLIDTADGDRYTNQGPFSSILEAEEDAQAWWFEQHLSKAPH